MNIFGFVIVTLVNLAYCGEHFSPLKDDIAYKINWLGSQDPLESANKELEYKKEDSFVITSANNERYTCTVPTKLSSTGKDGDLNSKGSTPPHALLAPIFKKRVCTYRFEPYWTYELCHGKHIRQYHEERVRTSGKSDETDGIIMQTESGKKILVENAEEKSSYVKTTEFTLGKISDSIDKDGFLLNPGKWPVTSKDVPFKVIDGVKTPYYPVVMADGTPCDLKSGSSRKSTIIYICRPTGRNEIISITETSSCEYELIVPSPDLCRNPLYNIEGKGVNDIQCVPMDGSPTKPRKFFDIEEALAASEKTAQMAQKTDEPLKNELHRVEETTISPLVDKSLLKDFLSGSFCLTGGSGWWRFEFCYGKHVHQYHDDSRLGRTTIVVGTWNSEQHEEWAKLPTSKTKVMRPDKDGKAVVSKVQHFYSNGETCDVTGKPRQVVVQLKCKKDALSPHAVTIYLLEPSTCQYILGVESLIVCDLLDSADDLGLLNADALP
uniref:Endoplasmic reticulum lectin 1 n=1 Tax=Phallusia mammillata TaxID=59560 RepID=A0A6F9DBL0_9ASCI|nr:endoplasmic reticulum lectin 1 [Phallusia mammillata]